ncbi:MAG: tetratricopeptide repeat protein [Chloroflexota bacterium]
MMLSPFITVDNKLFLGRVEEQKQFRAALKELLDATESDNFPYVCLLHGDGGIGKTTLAKRFRDIATVEKPFADAFEYLWVDWEDERKKLAGLQVGRENVTAEVVFKGIYTAAIRKKWGRQFPAYRKALEQANEAEQKVAEILTREDSWEELALLRSVGVGAIAKIIRTRIPLIGDSGEQLVQTFLDAGVQVGAEQAAKLRAILETYLRARLKPGFFDHFLNPNEQLAHALARGLAKVAEKKRLIVFLDSYEVVDRADIWIRSVIRAAGSRVMWVISDRNDLVHSRQFGNEYFKGYADDSPRRLLAYRMHPLAVDDIHQYFAAQDRALSKEEAEAISRATRGIPLAVQEAADVLSAGATFAEVVGDLPDVTPGDQIVRRMTDRYMQHVVADSDRQAIYALALARGDVDVLRAMVAPEESRAFDLDALIHRLERDYASVHADRARLHDDPSLFIREYLKAEVRRSGTLVRQLNQQAVTVLRQRLSDAEKQTEQIETRCQDESWVQWVLDLTESLLWLDEKETWHWLTPRFVEGLAYNADLCRGLLAVLAGWREQLSESGQQVYVRLTAVYNTQPALEDEANMLQVLQRMAQQGWFDGPGVAERQAILQWRQGLLAQRQRRYEAALRAYEAAEAGIPPAGIVLRQHLADALEGVARHAIWVQPSGNPGAALDVEAILQKVVAWQPQRASGWYYLGVVTELDGRFPEALAHYEKALQIDPKYAIAHQGIGSVQQALGNADAALQAYRQAARLNAQFAAPHIGMGEVYQKRGARAEAIKAYRKAVTLEPQASTPHLRLGALYLAEGRDEEARASYETAVSLSPNDAAAHAGLGQTYAQTGQTEAALAAYQQALLLEPENADTLAAMGLLLCELGRFQDAQVVFQKAIAANPHHAAA